VEDLCAAHLAAMIALKPGSARFYNLGIGRGYSVKEVIDSARRVTGIDISIEYGPRRAGDPAILFADADKIRRELGWSARYTDIDAMVSTAWKWLKNHPNGYK
jgi:UDP-glucose 4-epimerase